MSTFYGITGICCMILAVGCIDGPTGYESNNWLGFGLFTVSGIVLMLRSVLLSQED